MCLFTVTETFFLTSRGLILLPGLSTPMVTVGSTIRLVRPDKTDLITCILGISFSAPHDVLLEENVAKEDVPVGTEVWLVEYKRPDMTVKQLLHQLKLVKRRDVARQLFGASTHRYRLNWTLSRRHLRDFERLHQVQLPKDYRDFLEHGGDGGAGPAYGLLRLRQWSLEAPTMNENYLSTPFPHAQAWNIPPLDDDLSDEEYDIAIVEREAAYFKEEYTTGSIRICHYGCAIYYLLVVTGPEAGNIWVDDRASDQGIYPLLHKTFNHRMSFTEWYNEWLTESLEQIERL